jgi:hypothetical protein
VVWQSASSVRSLLLAFEILGLLRMLRQVSRRAAAQDLTDHKGLDSEL